MRPCFYVHSQTLAGSRPRDLKALSVLALGGCPLLWPQDLQSLAKFKARRVCQLLLLPQQNISVPQLWCCWPPGAEMAAVCPARPGWGAAAAGWHGRKARGHKGMVAGGQAKGAGLQPAHVCEACLGSLPASTRERERGGGRVYSRKDG